MTPAAPRSWPLPVLAYVVVCLALLGGAVLRLTTAPEAAPVPAAERVVVVGVPGLDWSDVSATDTPALLALAERAGAGSLTSRGTSSYACPRDGWATLGAGNRAGVGGPPCLTDEEGTQLEGDVDTGNGFGAELGLLGRQVGCTVAHGYDTRYALLGADDVVRADAGLRTPEQWIDSWSTCPLALVGGPAVRDDGQDPGALERADALIGSVAQAVATEPDTLLMVVGVSDRQGSPPGLHLALVTRGGIEASLLRSASTGRAPFVQLIDVAPTVLAALDEEQPAAMVGRPMTSVGADDGPAERIDALVSAERSADAQRASSAWLVWTWLVVTGLYLLVALVLLRRPDPVPGVRVAGVVVASLPVAMLVSNALPWAGTDAPGLFRALGILAAALALSALALLGPWRHTRWGPTLTISAAGALVLAVDVVTGSHLQLDSLIGYNATVAGRFTGFGNMPFAVYAVGGIAVLAAVLGRLVEGGARRTAYVAAGIGSITMVLLNGAPGIGADFGGVLSIVPALALTTMLALGARLSIGRVAAALLGGVLVVAVLAVADYQRAPSDQTHLGRFVGQLLDGTAWTIVERKGQANLDLLTGSPVATLAPILLIALAVLFATPTSPGRLLLARSDAHSGPGARAGVIGAAVAVVIGSIVNDSGIAIFVAGAACTVPLVFAACAASRPHDPPPAAAAGRDAVAFGVDRPHRRDDPPHDKER